MNRKIAVFVVGLLALGALEFGLLGASASGLVGGASGTLPPISQRGLVPATATPIATTTAPPTTANAVGSIELSRPAPAMIECDGAHPSTVRVFVRDSSGSPVPDGTFMNFSVFNGSASPYYAKTSSGSASTSVVLYSDSYSQQPNVVVNSGDIETAIRLRCKPNSNCPVSPPAGVSPPCEPPPFTCNPSPGIGSPISPPCIIQTPISPPICAPNQTSPPCTPLSPPPCKPIRTSPQCATATPIPGCAPYVAVSPPCAPPTPASPQTHGGGDEPCADVDGDGRVTSKDVSAIIAHVVAPYRPQFDVNDDRHVNVLDVQIAIRQLGHRC